MSHETAIDVVGIGNAIVDIIGRCDDAFLQDQGLAKGHMRLVDGAEIDRLYALMGPAIEMSGGSAANTCAGLASLGARTAFIGKVANDEFGRIFRHDIRSVGVAFESADAPADGTAAQQAGGTAEPTARSLILVTPDGERTMNTHLGISPHLDNGVINPDVIASARILYLEGYLFDRPDAKAAFHEAAHIAASSGTRVALSLSDSFCVERHRAAFRALIRDRVDLLFANADEICALYETPSFDEALRAVGRDSRLAAITRGAAGSVVLAPDETIEVPAAPIDKVVDTTGAGDLYAAGFLHGWARGKPLGACGALASLAAGEIISHMGARPEHPLDSLARARGLEP